MADGKTPEKNSDAVFRFALSEDGMKLGVSRYFPPNGGKPPSVELLCQQVADAGVQLPVDEEAAQRVIEAIKQDNPFTGITLVRGIEPKEPQHGALIALGDLNFPVFPQDRFARFRKPQKAENGQTIDGRTVLTQKEFEPEDLEVSVGDNVDWDPATESYVSQVWGMARLKGGVIKVDPIPRISEDEITVTGNLHHKDFKGDPITPAKLDKVMRDLGVVIDMDMDRIDAKLKQAALKGSALLNEPIIEGRHPVPGRDGWLEYLVSTRETTGTEDEAGRLDFRNRGTYPLVNPGQPIGRYHHPTQGEGGIDIYGKTIPANAGHEMSIRVGENVVLLDDGVTYQAKAKGVVAMDRGELSVTECMVINGNVDLNSGNVKVEFGSVKVRGSIQAGFSVSAPKQVIVEGSIESASVYAGGTVEVRGGILMPDGGQVVCDGDVIANYATNAKIKAGGDVTIANEVTNSSIQTEGRLIAVSGKGTVIGGVIKTGKGAEVNEIGSELGVATTIIVDVEHPEDDELREQRKKITHAIRKIDDTLGTDDPKDILLRTPEAKRAAVAEVLKHKQTLMKRRKSITEQIHKLIDARLGETDNAVIQVKRMVYPGAVVKFGKKGHQFEKRLEASVLYWDVRNRQVGIK